MYFLYCLFFFFFFKQKTAYEMRISDWSSDVCSSDLAIGEAVGLGDGAADGEALRIGIFARLVHFAEHIDRAEARDLDRDFWLEQKAARQLRLDRLRQFAGLQTRRLRSEEHTSELQSLMRISYAVFCLKKTTSNIQKTYIILIE